MTRASKLVSTGGALVCVLVNACFQATSDGSGLSATSQPSASASPAPRTSGSTTAAGSAAPPTDEASGVVAKCGPPTRDFVKVEGGEHFRHLVYKRQNLELIYLVASDRVALTGLFPANDDPMADFVPEDEARRRLPCAASNIKLPATH